MKVLGTLAIVLLSLPALVSAAVPPDRVNYQGVLRDGTGAPRNGSFDISFHLFDQPTAGNEVLVDRHLAGNTPPQAVVVANGLFNVEIGSGQMLDGAGPGTFTTLGAAFGSQGSLWLEIEVNAETLTPRLHLAAAGYALNAGTLEGQPAGTFVNTGSQTQFKSGTLLVGTPGNGPFASLNDSGYGVIAKGSGAGGAFIESDSTATADLAKGGVGISASGPSYGAYFGSTNSSGYAYLGNSSTQIGIQAYGLGRGGYFASLDGTTTVSIAQGGSYSRAGVFDNLVSGAHVHLAEGGGATDDGIWAESGSHYGFGGVFISGLWNGLVGGGGIAAVGEDRGGYFEDTNSSGWANVGYDTFKIYGSGSVAFVQNHPTETDKVIVYNAPEGDEVATYARGSARLIDGEAHIALGETFAWVTNPDLGLTAYVTPVGEWADLYVVSQSTKELVVRSRDPESADVAFNYLVFGLRIGFEEASIVQAKDHEAFIPSMAGHRKLYADHPELRRFNALERTKRMRTGMGLEALPDLSASTALKNAIHEFDPKADKGSGTKALEGPRRGRDAAASGGNVRGPISPASPSPGTAAAPMEPGPGEAGSALLPAGPRGSSPGSDPAGAADHAAAPGPGVAPVETLRVSEPVRAGELLAIDPLAPESVRRAEGIGDPRFVGIAAQDSVDDEVVLATTRIVRVQADAAFGAIAPGDLLTTSPLAGLAMRAVDAAPGTVFGKALDRLESGTGEIRVLWMPR